MGEARDAGENGGSQSATEGQKCIRLDHAARMPASSGDALMIRTTHGRESTVFSAGRTRVLLGPRMATSNAWNAATQRLFRKSTAFRAWAAEQHAEGRADATFAKA